jgi:hypothetical protein
MMRRPVDAFRANARLTALKKAADQHVRHGSISE